MGSITSFIAASDSGVLAGTSQGGHYWFDSTGRTCEARALAEGAVQATLHPDGSLAAALCDGTLSFFRGSEGINVTELSEHPRGLKMLGEGLMLRGSKNLDVMNAQG